jgi:hypothetical protein
MFVTDKHALATMQTDIIYQHTLARLKADIEAHVCPSSGKAHVKAFCAEYGINRPNLVHVLGGHGEMSVALFIRICEALGKLAPGRVMHDAKQLDRLSLRGYLAVDYTAIMQTVLGLHLDKPAQAAE